MAVHQMEHELSGMDEKIAHGAGLSALWASWARYVYEKDVYKRQLPQESLRITVQ